MAAAVIVAVCAYLYYVTTWIIEIPPALAQGIQPATYPQQVIFAILLVHRTDGNRGAQQAAGRARTGSRPRLLDHRGDDRRAAIATWVDFFLAMIVFVTVCVPLWGMRRYAVAFLYAVAMAAILYAMFATLLRVRFPDSVFDDVFRHNF